MIVYQDQVLQIANKLAGYSLGEADLLRRAMGKKKPDEMAKQRERFVSGAMKNNIEAKKAEKIFDLIAEFAELRLPEVALDGLRADHLPDRLSEGEPRARVPRGAAHRRVGQPRQADALHRPRPRQKDRDPAAGRERVRARLHGGLGRRHPLRLRGRQERRRGRDRGDRRSAASDDGRFRASSTSRARRRQAREPARRREPREGAAPSTRCTRIARRSGRPSTPRSSAAPRPSAIARSARAALRRPRRGPARRRRCPTRRPGPSRSDSATRASCSAST